VVGQENPAPRQEGLEKVQLDAGFDFVKHRLQNGFVADRFLENAR
jgi:hypothetical protein